LLLLSYLPLVDPIVIVFDADCGVCQASVAWAKRRDVRHRLRFVPNDAELPKGVSREETEHTVVVLDGERKWTRAGATARVLGELPFWSALGWVLRTPGLRWIADRAYDRFARNRHRVSAALGLRSCAIAGRPGAAPGIHHVK
jgi:predicted DCC family thiol-disulfide oxidoreductase YuxK